MNTVWAILFLTKSTAKTIRRITISPKLGAGTLLGGRELPKDLTSMTVAGGRAWICWDDGPAAETTRRVLVERLLPLIGVEIFSSRGRHWHRPSARSRQGSRWRCSPWWRSTA